MSPIVDALLLLRPFDIDQSKIRIGPEGDGGYVFVDELSAEQPVLSFGIGTEYGLDLAFARRGHSVYMFDHTIDGVRIDDPNVHFFREGVAGRSDAAKGLYSIADHLTRHAIEGDRLIVKLDVEGAEIEALTTAPDDVLARVDQLIIEVHDLDKLVEREYRSAFVHVFSRLNRYLTLFHVHANNFDGPDAFAIIGGFIVPRIIELSYVRSASVKPRRSRTLYPTILDFPNTNQREKLLWMFPFLPTVVESADFSMVAARVNASRENDAEESTSTGWHALLRELESKEAEVQRIAAASLVWREQLETKEAEIQRLAQAGVLWREQLDAKEAELQNIARIGASWREQLEIKEAELQRVLQLLGR